MFALVMIYKKVKARSLEVSLGDLFDNYMPEVNS